jgi:hypothetical protein
MHCIRPCPSNAVSRCIPSFAHAQSSPFLASSIFLSVSPSLYPPLLAHTATPSPSSTLSSVLPHAQGQWCGKCTHDSVPGQRYLSQCAVLALVQARSMMQKRVQAQDVVEGKQGGGETYRSRTEPGTSSHRCARSAAAAVAAAAAGRRTSGRRSRIVRRRCGRRALRRGG